jgi:molecular chaperone HscB
VTFTLDQGLLQERYRALQKQVHPDRFAHAPDQEQRVSLQYSMRVNEAFQTLKTPLLRAQYLLGLKGGDTEHATTHDAGFLMEQMALREQLAELRDVADARAALGELMARISAMRGARIDELAVQLSSDADEMLDAARESVRKLQFLDKLMTEAEAVESDLEGIH